MILSLWRVTLMLHFYKIHYGSHVERTSSFHEQACAQALASKHRTDVVARLRIYPGHADVARLHASQMIHNDSHGSAIYRWTISRSPQWSRRYSRTRRR